MAEVTKKEKELLEDFDKILDQSRPPSFNAEVVDIKVIDDEIEYQQQKYLQEVLACQEESKLADENLEDLDKLGKKKKAKVIGIAMDKAEKQDPKYFENNEVPDELMYPVQQAEAILQKAQEVKRHEWSIEYRTRLIEKLRDYKFMNYNEEEKISLSFTERLKALVFGEVIRYLKKQ